MKTILCKLGFHKPVPIGEAPYPYGIKNRTLIGMGCEKCKKKLRRGYLIYTSELGLFYLKYGKRR